VSLTLRQATVADADLLRAWRNDPGTLAASWEREPVEPAGHVRWLSGVLADPNRHLLVAEEGARPVGQVRFDGGDDGAWLISVAIAPEERGRGLGSELIRAGVAWLCERDGGARVLAQVRTGNEQSLRAFDRAGFERTREEPERGMVVLESACSAPRL
jgi:RimJ/RimL family protein N-acetyltransferase